MANVVKPKSIRKEHAEEGMAIPVDQRQLVVSALNEFRYFYLKPMLLTMMFAGLHIGRRLDE